MSPRRALGLPMARSGWLTASTASFPGGAESIVMHFEAGSLRLAEGTLTVQWRDGRIETQGAQAGTGGGADPMAFTHDWHQTRAGGFPRHALDTGQPAARLRALGAGGPCRDRRHHPIGPPWPSHARGAPMTIRFAALGLDHRHIYGMAQNMIDAGAEFAAWWTEGEPGTLDGFLERFPENPRIATNPRSWPIRPSTSC